jgi:hypothetical protein
MLRLNPDAEPVLREWIEKADADLEVARRMAEEAGSDLGSGKSLAFIANKLLKNI